MNQGVETGKSFLEAKRDGRVHKPRPEVRSPSALPKTAGYRKTAVSTAPVKIAVSLPGGKREV